MQVDWGDGEKKKDEPRKTGVKRRHGEKSVDFPNF